MKIISAHIAEHLELAKKTQQMKLLLPVFFLMIWVNAALASSDIHTRVIELDGLPLRLSDGLKIDISEDKFNEYGSINMDSYFMDLGVDVPLECLIFYSASSGTLVARLTKEGHLLLDTALAYLYRHDNQVAIIRAYVTQLQALSDEERLAMVLNIGFMPDPLISSFISKIRQIEKPLIEAEVAKKTFPKGAVLPENNTLIPELRRIKIKQRLTPMKKNLAKLLEISLQRLSDELDIIDSSGADTKAPANKPAK